MERFHSPCWSRPKTRRRIRKPTLRLPKRQLETLGIDKNDPSPVVPVYAPISGVMIQQNVTQAAAAGVTFSGSATAFTIADLSSVWVICDVYENDIPKLALGQDSEDQAERVSRPGSDRPHLRHRPSARSQHSHCQGTHRGPQSRHSQAGHVRHGDILESKAATALL